MAKKEKNLKGLKKGELEEKLGEVRETLRVLRFKAEGARTKNVKESQFLRKEIARILTALRANK